MAACVVLAAPLQARAQSAAAAPDPAQAVVDKAAADLRTASAGIHSHSISDDELRARLEAIPPIQSDLAHALAVLTPRLQEIDARLAQLGPPPAANQPPESAETTAARKTLQRSREAVDGEVKQARLLAVVAEQTSTDITGQLKSNFETRLWTRGPSVFDAGLYGALADAYPKMAGRVVDVTGDGWKAVRAAARTPRNALILILGAVAALFLLGPGRLVLNQMGYFWAARAGAGGSRLRRSGLAVWLVLVAAFAPLFAGEALRSALAAAGASVPDFDALLTSVFRAIALASLIAGLGRALLSSGRSSWRLAPIPDGVVDRLAPYPVLIGLAAALAALTSRLDVALGLELSTLVTGQRLTVALEILSVGAALWALIRAGGIKRDAVAVDEHPHLDRSRLPWLLAALAAWLALAVALVALVGGYLALSAYLMREMIWIAIVLALLFIAVLFVDDLFPALVSADSPLGRILRNAIGVGDKTLDHLAVLFSGLARLALYLTAWSAVLLPLGASPADVIARLSAIQSGFKLGQVTISPGAVAAAVALFLVGLGVTRAVRGWLEVRYLPKTHMDMGVRTSLSALFSYVGGAIAALLAFAYLGLSFTQITLVASALSVGIGFGLQSVIGNFVSGLILLVERPVKVGDWVAIGDLEGDVKAINIRATEIDMWDRSKLVVPNSELVSKTVRNVTHAGAIGRVRIVLRLDGSVNPEAVRELVLGHLKANPKIIAAPAPAVFFTDVRDGGLEFTAIAYVPSPRDAFGAKSELLFKIVPDLQAKGMPLLNANTVVNLALPDRLIEPSPED
jgi:small-conductance mechanosensitive channel